ncbi:hypothetical protein PENSTE_c010G08680 [Penicillium steckii]|uniref:Zn(2)-C6 fungal-type domain-containing protein n=1 Tax=Penicillium steckii TaxID=303698 RepID=A0A1V6T8H7_9EURO|nr:hypothetical protein PENSTE_c010G08680 [Penicillium steckii]
MPVRRTRAAAACLFCRQKKLKCDAQRPTCGSCASKGIDCQFGATRHKPRPTNHRIAQLELENARLRQSQFSDGEDSFLSQPASSLSPVSPDQARIATSTPQDNESLRSNSHPEVPDSGHHTRRAVSLYHGPTSTAYDDTTRSADGVGNVDIPNDPASEDWARNLLFVQTARQRQLEPLNLANDKLDFDGVDPEIGMHLLSIYWSRQLYTAQIIYRPVFMRDMACAGPYFSKLLLNAIFFTVSKHCPRIEIRFNPEDITTAGWSFRQRFTELLRDNFDKSKVTTIQALLIMSNSLFSRCDERSLSWLYAGNAFNMIIDLGLHVACSRESMSAEELEIRKRVLWGAYSIDKIQCLFQGRPPLLRHNNIKASLKFLDEYDELDPFQAITYKQLNPTPAIPSMNVSLLTKLCELSVIIDRILCELYSESAQMIRGQSEGISDNINAELSRWRQNLPPELDYLCHPARAVLLPQAFCLLALFNVSIILSKRPLFTGNDERPNNPAAAFESINTCTTAANQIVQILSDYSQHFSISSAPYMLSYATYISATIHARIVAQKGSTSSSFQSLKLCRNVLKEHQPLYGAAGKAKDSLQRLCDHLGIGASEENQQAQALTEAGPRDLVVTNGPAQNVQTTSIADQPIDLNSQIHWELSDLDLEAIAQGFRFDGELDYLMHPVGM